MINKNTAVWLVATCLIFWGVFGISAACAQETIGSDLETARWLYHHESYEEALPILLALRKQDPNSSETAFYLGLTYKKLQDFISAKPHLIAAATLPQIVENALPELIDLLYQCDQLEEAKKWIGQAEQLFVAPAQVAFFKGLVLSKENKDLEGALKAFEDSLSLDPSLEQAVTYQKGLILTQQKIFKEAKNVFKQIVVKDPAADLAAYANEYMDAISRSQDAVKPLRGSIGYALQYDDNVVFKPNDGALSTDVSSDSDFVHVATAQGEYTLKPTDRIGLKFGVGGYVSKHDDIGYYDIASYDFPVQPIIYFENATVAFPVHYNYVSVNDQRYLETEGVSNQNNIMLGKNSMLQTQVQFNNKEYRWTASTDDEKKDSREYVCAAGWYRFFARNQEGFFNVRYAANYEDALGRNWSYIGNRVTVTTVVPIKKVYQWNFVADYFRQDFSHRNSSYDKTRRDNVVTVSNLLSREFARSLQVYVQHTFVYDGASIGVYKYKKNVYSVGTQYRF